MTKMNFEKHELVKLNELWTALELADTFGIKQDINILTELRAAIVGKEENQKQIDAAAEKEDAKRRKKNPFALYYIDDGVNRDTSKSKDAKRVSNKIKKLLDKLIADLDVELTVPAAVRIITPVADEIREFYKEGVGVGDTMTDEMIAGYLERGLTEKWQTLPKIIDKLGRKFYYMIH